MITRSDKMMMMEQQRDIYSERNDCSVIALAIALEYEYIDAWMMMHKQGRKKRAGSTVFDLQMALHQANVPFNVIKRRLLRSIAERMGKKRMTVNLLQKSLNDKKTYMIVIRGHIFTMTNGEIHDFKNSGRSEVMVVLEIMEQKPDTLTLFSEQKPFKAEQLQLI